MGNFSRNPDDELNNAVDKKYVGVRIEQNVPLLERDLNLATDLLGANLRGLIQEYIGDGTGIGNDGASAITPASPVGNDFKIGAGTMLVGGIEVVAPPQMRYSTQTGAPPLKVPVGQRVDTVYIDVWLGEVVADQTVNVDLLNADDIQMPTSVRLRPSWAVRVAEGSDSAIPAADQKKGHAYCILAVLSRVGAEIEVAEISDRRYQRLQLVDLMTRVAAVEQDIALLMNALKPSFWVARPSDKPSGYNGREIVPYGKNFDSGDVQATAGNGQSLVAVEIVGDPQPNAITVFLRTTLNFPYGIPPVGDITFNVKTALGTATSPEFRNWGPPVWNANTPFTPDLIPNGQPFVINGAFLDAPGLEVQVQLASNPNGPWIPLGVSQPTETTVHVTALPMWDTFYKIRMRSEVAQSWTVYGSSIKSVVVLQFP